MKKIPTLFVREFDPKTHKIVSVKNEITPGCEEAFRNGVATVKIDGTCCAIIDGEFYKRYDAKKGKTPPEGAIPCCDPDPVTGHWPHWVKVDRDNPENKWITRAYYKARGDHGGPLEDGTYEAVGPHIQGNPYKLEYNMLIRHGTKDIHVWDMYHDFDDVKRYLKEHEIEGIVFWLNGEPVCKIKRSDFGFNWPVKVI